MIDHLDEVPEPGGNKPGTCGSRQALPVVLFRSSQPLGAGCSWTAQVALTPKPTSVIGNSTGAQPGRAMSRG